MDSAPPRLLRARQRWPSAALRVDLAAGGPRPSAAVDLSAHNGNHCGNQFELPSLAPTCEQEEVLLPGTVELREMADPLPCGGVLLSDAIDEPCGVDVVPCREVVLRVDETGAGLVLVEDLYGLLVEAVEDSPGQDVAVGEVILEINGVPLWGVGEGELASATFRVHFAAGVTLRCAPRTSVQYKAVWHPLPPAPPAGAFGAAEEGCLWRDVEILGLLWGVEVELFNQLPRVGIALWGPPAAQRGAWLELHNVLCFYLPEVSNRAAPVEFCDRTASFAGLGPAQRLEGEAVRTACEGWQTALLAQWQEDANPDLTSLELPLEPLDAPDDGPAVFEGETHSPGARAELPFRLLILVGLPGSGKSTLAASLQEFGWTIVNQDTLGDRRACERAARKAVTSPCGRAVIDRCNPTRAQRLLWVSLANEHRVAAGCIWLDVPSWLCGERVLQRFDHPSLPAAQSSLRVVRRFEESLEPPDEAEGFLVWRVDESPESLHLAVVEVAHLSDLCGPQVDSVQFEAMVL